MAGIIKPRQFTPIVSQLTRSFASGKSSKFELPSLPYDYGDLEPAITGQIMETHHKKHHNTYVTNLNKALEQIEEAESKGDLKTLIKLQSPLNFNGGGHINHSIFWTNLAPPRQGGGDMPTGDLSDQIQKNYGSFDKMKDLLTQEALGVQGSGWAWLGYCKKSQCLQIKPKQNQDVLTEYVPLLGIDVWEHAYYYKYGPARAEYLKNIWSVINWKNVQERLREAKSG